MSWKIGVIDGIKYKMTRDKLGNQQACDEQYHNSKYWFVWTEYDEEWIYRGCTGTQKEAYSLIQKDRL